MKRHGPTKLCLLLVAAAQAALSEDISYHKDVNLDVPDASTSGIASTIDVAELGTINSVSITLNLQPSAGATAFLGDLYAYVQHGADKVVLLNRPGRTDIRTTGYDDNVSLSVSFSDTGANDIHNYRIPLTGNDSQPLLIPVTGVWQADGRPSNPDTVFDTDPRAEHLADFNGAVSSDSWTLFVSDVSAGGQVYFSDWSMTANITAIPEPTVISLLGIIPLSLAIRRRLRASKNANGRAIVTKICHGFP